MTAHDDPPSVEGLTLGLELIPSGGKWIDSSPDGTRIGSVCLRSWDLHPALPMPADYEGHDAYAIRLNYEWDIDPGRPRPLWLEAGFDFSLAGQDSADATEDAGRATVLDALPRTVLEAEAAASYELNQSLLFVPSEVGGAGLIHQTAVAPVVDVFGIGGSQVRWRHSRELPVPLRPSSYSAWVVVLVPAGCAALSVEASVRYELEAGRRADHWTDVFRSRFVVELRPPSVPREAVSAPNPLMGPAIPPVPSEEWPRMEIVGEPKRLFICYAHDDPAHKELVRRFGNFLCANGLDAHMDCWDCDSRRNWASWATEQILKADFVLAIASPRFKSVGNGEVAEHENLGLKSELRKLFDLLQSDYSKWLKKILPVVLPGRSTTELPIELEPKSADYFIVDAFTPKGAAGLLRIITDQAEFTRPRVAPQIPRFPTE